MRSPSCYALVLCTIPSTPALTPERCSCFQFSSPSHVLYPALQFQPRRVLCTKSSRLLPSLLQLSPSCVTDLVLALT
ncbi:hypothetical protein C8R48DRAFT_714960 [Suillus tomentosus]|nr:hypothetical protein C8R48DRAFT_714960 [Suillus tomentosus]